MSNEAALRIYEENQAFALECESFKFSLIENEMALQIDKLGRTNEAYNAVYKLDINHKALDDLLCDGGGLLDEIITAFNMSPIDFKDRCYELITNEIDGEFLKAIIEDGYLS